MAKVNLPNGQTMNVPDGATPEQVQAWVSQALKQQIPLASQHTRDTFEGESGVGALRELMSQGYKAVTEHPGKQLPGDAWNVLKGMYNGQVAETQSEQEKIIPAISTPGDSALRHLVGSVPIVGHPLSHLGKNLEDANIPGMLGDVAALFGGEFLRRGASALGSAERAGANTLYRSGVNFPQSISKERAVSAAETALQEKIPTGDTSIPMKGGPGKTGAYIKKELDSRSQYLTGLNGLFPVDMATILKEPLDAIRKAAGDKTPEGQAHVAAMLGELVGWQKAHTNGLSVAEAEAAKEAMYGRVSPAQYADNTTPIPGAPKVIKEELVRGLKNGVAEVHPNVDYHNQRIQSGIDLQDALKAESKVRPAVAQKALLWSLGPIIGDLATMAGHSNLGMNGLIALAAGQALHEPAIATRLALAFNGNGKMLQALGRIPRTATLTGQTAGQIAARDPALNVDQPDVFSKILDAGFTVANNMGAPLDAFNQALRIPYLKKTP